MFARIFKLDPLNGFALHFSKTINRKHSVRNVLSLTDHTSWVLYTTVLNPTSELFNKHYDLGAHTVT